MQEVFLGLYPHVLMRQLPGDAGSTGAELLPLWVGPVRLACLCRRGESVSSLHGPAGQVKDVGPLYETQAQRDTRQTCVPGDLIF